MFHLCVPCLKDKYLVLLLSLSLTYMYLLHPFNIAKSILSVYMNMPMKYCSQTSYLEFPGYKYSLVQLLVFL